MKNLSLDFMPDNPSIGDSLQITATDAVTGAPVSNLDVLLLDHGLTIDNSITDSNGQASFILPEGELLIRVSGEMYNAAEFMIIVTPNGTVIEDSPDFDNDGVSDEFEVSAAGVNMLFAKSKAVAEDDLKFVLFPSIIILAAVMMFALRNLQIVAATLGGVGLVICAEAGLLSAFGFTFSVIDGIALPIILAVAVDGAFWYCKSSMNREEER